MVTFFLLTKITDIPSLSHTGATDHKNSQNTPLTRYIATTEVAATEILWVVSIFMMFNLLLLSNLLNLQDFAVVSN